MKVDATLAGAPADCAALIADAEARSFDRALVTESAHDPFQLLAVAAQRTSRIELGTGVAIAFARSPMTLAYSGWTLHALSGGRAVIGLGSQVRAHVVRRFAMPWSRPAARMREFVLATRAIWECWQDGTKLDFRGAFTTHTLMPQPFNPGPLPYDPPRLLVAAVGPRMAEAAGSVGDGIICHPFATAGHLRERVLPAVFAARAASERGKAAWTTRPFEVCGGVLAAVGRTDRELEQAIEGVRERIAFYGATPGYEAVLATLGQSDLHIELHGLSQQNRWQEMGRLVDDDLLHAMAVVGTPAQAARELRVRYDGVLDRVSLALSRRADPVTALETLTELRALSSP